MGNPASLPPPQSFNTPSAAQWKQLDNLAKAQQAQRIAPPLPPVTSKVSTTPLPPLAPPPLTSETGTKGTVMTLKLPSPPPRPTRPGPPPLPARPASSMLPMSPPPVPARPRTTSGPPQLPARRTNAGPPPTLLKVPPGLEPKVSAEKRPRSESFSSSEPPTKRIRAGEHRTSLEASVSSSVPSNPAQTSTVNSTPTSEVPTPREKAIKMSLYQAKELAASELSHISGLEGLSTIIGEDSSTVLDELAKLATNPSDRQAILYFKEHLKQHITSADQMQQALKKLEDDFNQKEGDPLKTGFDAVMGLCQQSYAAYADSILPLVQSSTQVGAAIQRIRDQGKSRSIKRLAQIEQAVIASSSRGKTIGTGLDQRIILPVQRLPRYSLFMNDFEKTAKDMKMEEIGVGSFVADINQTVNQKTLYKEASIIDAQAAGRRLRDTRPRDISRIRSGLTSRDYKDRSKSIQQAEDLRDTIKHLSDYHKTQHPWNPPYDESKWIADTGRSRADWSSTHLQLDMAIKSARLAEATDLRGRLASLSQRLETPSRTSPAKLLAEANELKLSMMNNKKNYSEYGELTDDEQNKINSIISDLEKRISK